MKTAGANGANCQRRGRSAVDEEAKQQTHLDGIGIFWVGLEIKLLFLVVLPTTILLAHKNEFSRRWH